jgi:hypothetical protein
MCEARLATLGSLRNSVPRVRRYVLGEVRKHVIARSTK